MVPGRAACSEVSLVRLGGWSEGETAQGQVELDLRLRLFGNDQVALETPERSDKLGRTGCRVTSRQKPGWGLRVGVSSLVGAAREGFLH